MANLGERWEDNAPGQYYIDKACSLCNLCVDVAPNNIKESPEGDHCMVFKQPENDEERANMEEAVSQCPCEAIGNDGK